MLLKPTTLALSLVHFTSTLPTLICCFLSLLILDNFRREKYCTMFQNPSLEVMLWTDSSSQRRGVRHAHHGMMAEQGGIAMLLFFYLIKLGVQYSLFGYTGLMSVILVYGSFGWWDWWSIGGLGIWTGHHILVLLLPNTDTKDKCKRDANLRYIPWYHPEDQPRPQAKKEDVSKLSI